MKELGKEIPVKQSRNGIELPLQDRHYIELTGLSRKDAIVAFQNSTILQ
jgi:hypothetical protein